MYVCSIAYVSLFTESISISNDCFKYGSLCELKGLGRFENRRFLFFRILQEYNMQLVNNRGKKASCAIHEKRKRNINIIIVEQCCVRRRMFSNIIICNTQQTKVRSSLMLFTKF